MSNKLSYYEDGNKVADRAVIESVQSDDKGHFILLDHTIFYPQGGGQFLDQGQLQLGDSTIPILSVRMVDGEVRHYTDQDYSYAVGQKVSCSLNQEKRLLHSKLHTSGHLISNVLESHYQSYKAVKGHHFPGECFVEFSANNGSPAEIDVDLLKREINALISQDQPVLSIFVTEAQFRAACPDTPYAIPTTQTQSMRLVKIGSFSYQPCGGMHVMTTSQLRGLEITKVKTKNTSMKVYYSIKE